MGGFSAAISHDPNTILEHSKTRWPYQPKLPNNYRVVWMRAISIIMREELVEAQGPALVVIVIVGRFSPSRIMQGAQVRYSRIVGCPEDKIYRCESVLNISSRLP